MLKLCTTSRRFFYVSEAVLHYESFFMVDLLYIVQPQKKHIISSRHNLLSEKRSQKLSFILQLFIQWKTSSFKNTSAKNIITITGSFVKTILCYIAYWKRCTSGWCCKRLHVWPIPMKIVFLQKMNFTSNNITGTY